MRHLKLILLLLIACSFITPMREASSKSSTKVSKAEGPLALHLIKVKPKGSWTEVMLAIENTSTQEAKFQCCTVFLENTDGYAIASLTHDEVQSQIYNKAKTASIVGALAGAGLGLSGIISGKKELGYAATGVLVGSGAANVIGEASAEKARRELVIDDVMRNQQFPPELKVAGVSYFPPKKKWPGSSKPQAIHLTYKMNGISYRTSAELRSE